VRGDKIKLIQLSQRNAASYQCDILLARSTDKRAEKGSRELEKLKEDLRLRNIPEVIECFDNSNIQGSNPVASCVVFKNGKPSKSEYRHFNIKTVTGPDDFASMAEVVYRRYKRMLEEGSSLPDLIIIDGGKGQLNAAVDVLKRLSVYGKISIIGIAKRLEEIYVPDDPIPLYVDKNSSSLRLIQRVRDEAHRFGITFHRQKRSKSQLESIFDKIPGIGEKTKLKILKTESDLDKLKLMDLDQLQSIAGKKGAKMLLNYFNQSAS
jgi:excinuclease ABC subunit C